MYQILLSTSLISIHFELPTFELLAFTASLIMIDNLSKILIFFNKAMSNSSQYVQNNLSISRIYYGR